MRGLSPETNKPERGHDAYVMPLSSTRSKRPPPVIPTGAQRRDLSVPHTPLSRPTPSRPTVILSAAKNLSRGCLATMTPEPKLARRARPTREILRVAQDDNGE